MIYWTTGWNGAVGGALYNTYLWAASVLDLDYTWTPEVLI